MDKTLQILVVGPDPKLRAEFKAALSGVNNTNAAVTHFATDFRQAVESVRSRRPTLALVEMGSDLRMLKAFAEEVQAGSPETALAAVFHPDIFGPEVSESALMIEAIRAGMRDFLRRPLSSTDLEQLLDRLLHRTRQEPAKMGRIISFVSNKGGVGKSTLSVSTACGVATRFPGRTLLIDSSLQMGVASTMLDLKPSTTITDAVRQRDRLDETLLRQLATPHSCGLHLLAAPADAVEAAEVDDDIMSRILTLARRTYDYVIVDSFPLLDSVMMAVLDLSDRVFIVIESVVPTVLGAVKLIEVLDNLGFPKQRQRVILNRYSRFLGNLKPADVAQRLGRDVDFIVPYQKKLIIAANIGRPYALSASRLFGFGRVLHQMVREAITVEAQKGAAREQGTTQPLNDGVRNREEVTT